MDADTVTLGSPQIIGASPYPALPLLADPKGSITYRRRFDLDPTYRVPEIPFWIFIHLVTQSFI